MMRTSILFLILFFTAALTARAQNGKKFVPGYVVDVKGNKMTGLIQASPSGRGPIKGQGYIVYKADDKAPKTELSAGSVQYFVTGRDSFVVASAPRNAEWSRNELDFVQVLADEPVKIYALRNAGKSSSGFGVSPEIGIGGGIGTGGGRGFSYGGGGIGLSFGGGSFGGGHRTVYFAGSSPTELTEIIPENFIDVMSDVMADEPAMVEQVQSGKYHINRIESLIYEYYRMKSQHPQAADGHQQSM